MGLETITPEAACKDEPSRIGVDVDRSPGRVAWQSLFHLSRFGLAGLFIFAVGAKLLILTQFANNVSDLLDTTGFTGARWKWLVTGLVIGAEVLVAILLLLRRTMRFGALWSALLLTGFAAFALYYTYWLHGEKLECGCFGGIIGSQLGVTTAVRNLALLVPAAIVFAESVRRSGPSRS
jgi:Methylamine utilisation protein MauE